jgi:PKD repeat protein
MPSRRPRLVLLAALATLTMAALGASAGPAAAATPPDATGYQDQSYAPTTGSITGTKPESKLWYAHGSWWAIMAEPSKQNSIWRLDRGTETWADTGTIVESRTTATRADALSEPDGSLTIASHTFFDSRHDDNPKPVGSSTGGYLRRYTFNGSAYVQSGSPILIEPYTTETLVIDRDSTGALWATWTYDFQAWFSHTTPGNDGAWSPPQPVPGVGTLDSDDISSLVHFGPNGGNQIGIMVSDQTDFTEHFAVHQDGTSDLLWDSKVVPTGALSDDHINLKASADGRVFAALKTSESYPDTDRPLILLAVRSAAGVWSTDVFGTVADAHTRAIVLLDESHRLIHMFATDGQSGGDIVEKTTSMDAPDLPSGQGTVVIHAPSGPDLNDATSTKQDVDGSTGLVVLADDDQTQTYWHLDEPLGSATPTVQFTASPAQGTAPLVVTFSDRSTGYDGQSRTWSFGDGSPTSNAPSPTHAYTRAGSFTVTLTIAGVPTTRTVTVAAAPGGGGTTPPPADGGGGTTPPPAITTPPAAVNPPVAPLPAPGTPTTPSGGSGSTGPGSTTAESRDPRAPRLRGVIHLSGRRVSTTISCTRSGRASLSHRGKRLASARFTCRHGRAVVRFKLGPKGARRLRATRKPEVSVSVRIGARTTKLRHRLSRSSD